MATALPHPSISPTSAEALKSQPQQRIALVIQYLGSAFHGWQRQAKHHTVQQAIEEAIQSVLGYPVTLYGAGRTDAGVNAAGQVAHFDAPQQIPAYRWADILNHRLGPAIVIRASAAVQRDWHAQFSALWRRYRYTLYTEKRPNLFVRPYTWHYYYADLDADLIQSSLDPLVGYHELSAFRRAGSERSHSWIDVQDAICERQGPFVRIEVQADGFLYGMMRLLVGLLVQVGRGQRSPSNFTELWQARQRDAVKYSAPSQGLCLLRVGYEQFPFPRQIWFDTQPQFLLATEDKVSCSLAQAT